MTENGVSSFCCSAVDDLSRGGWDWSEVTEMLVVFGLRSHVA
jgi:hypothetical protein